MQYPTGALVAAAFAMGACTAAPAWPERVDIAVEVHAGGFAASSTSAVSSSARSPSDDLMICVIDADGAARCHHRGGVMSARARLAAGSATCPGADAVLRSPCRTVGCSFPGVPVPSSPFGLMIVELRAPRFGVPRHAVLDAAVVSGVSSRSAASDAPQIAWAMRALARCLAPGPDDDAPRPMHVERDACEDGFCQLDRSRVKLSPSRREGVTAGRVTDGLESKREAHR